MLCNGLGRNAHGVLFRFANALLLPEIHRYRDVRHAPTNRWMTYLRNFEGLFFFF